MELKLDGEREDEGRPTYNYFYEKLDDLTDRRIKKYEEKSQIKKFVTTMSYDLKLY